MVKKSDICIKFLTEKIQCIPNWHLCEKQDNIKGDEDALDVDPENVQYMDKVLRIPQMVKGVFQVCRCCRSVCGDTSDADDGP